MHFNPIPRVDVLKYVIDTIQNFNNCGYPAGPGLRYSVHLVDKSGLCLPGSFLTFAHRTQAVCA